jgi:hypothetical protein
MSEGVDSRELRLYWVVYSVSLPAAELGFHLISLQCWLPQPE